MDEIKIVPAAPSYKRPRPSTFGKGLVRLVVFLATLIPTCIIAWRIDLINQHIQPPVIVQKEIPPRIEPEPKPRRRVVPKTPQPIEPSEPSLQSSVAPVVPDADIELPSHDTKPEPPPEPQPLPTQVISLTFEKEVQRELITLNGDVRVIRVDGCRHSLNPTTGVPPLTITLEGPRSISVSVSVADGKMTVEPTVVNDLGKTVPFTTKYLDVILRRVIKTGQRAANELAVMKSDQETLQANFNAGVPMPYLEFRAAQARFAQLNAIIPKAEKTVAALEIEARATQSLAQFAHDLSGKCMVVLEASNVPNQAPQPAVLYENLPALLTPQDLEDLKAIRVTRNDKRRLELQRRIFDYLETAQTIAEFEHALAALNQIDDATQDDGSTPSPSNRHYSNASTLNSWIGDSVDAALLARKYNAALNSPYSAMVDARRIFEIHCRKLNLTQPQAAKSAANDLYRRTKDARFSEIAGQL